MRITAERLLVNKQIRDLISSLVVFNGTAQHSSRFLKSFVLSHCYMCIQRQDNSPQVRLAACALSLSLTLILHPSVGCAVILDAWEEMRVSSTDSCLTLQICRNKIMIAQRR